ncbi:MAG: ATP-dependent metallopeptidase FtsH/Yme1/Tma family protein, partial [bacterium]
MKEPEKKPINKQLGFSIWYIIIAALFFISFLTHIFGPATAESISYSEFKELVKEGRVETCQITSSLIRGTLRGEDLQKKKAFVTARVEDPELVKELEAQGIKYSGKYESPWIQTFLFAWIIPIAIFFLIWR